MDRVSHAIESLLRTNLRRIGQMYLSLELCKNLTAFGALKMLSYQLLTFMF